MNTRVQSGSVAFFFAALEDPGLDALLPLDCSKFYSHHMLAARPAGLSASACRRARPLRHVGRGCRRGRGQEVPNTTGRRRCLHASFQGWCGQVSNS